MKLSAQVLFWILLSLSVSAQNDLRTFYVDFGPDDDTNGTAVTGEQINGKFWNAFSTNSTTAIPLILNADNGSPTMVSVRNIRALSGRGLRDGGLTTPDVNLLGDFAIPEVTQDFFRTGSTGSLEFGGLDPERSYRFELFAGQDNPTTQVTRYTVLGLNTADTVLTTSGDSIGVAGFSGNVSQIVSAGPVVPLPNGTVTLEITAERGGRGYLSALRLVEAEGVELCSDRDENLITVIGSSVARGQGAPNDMGYAFRYTELLENRFEAGSSDNDFTVRNVSVGGDNTIRVLGRFTRDVSEACGGYVIIGLSLANEGIRNGGQRTYDQFRDNLEAMIERSRALGLTPVIVSNYPRGDYDAEDYQFIQNINLEIYEWAVPSVNVLGAVDDGTGRWAAGLQDDVGHPNAAGHELFFRAFVPSLLDAIDAGKPVPDYQDVLPLPFDMNDFDIYYTPEEGVLSYTWAVDFIAPPGGRTLFRFSGRDGSRNYTLTSEDGILSFNSENGGAASTDNSYLDGQVYGLAVSYSHAREETTVFVSSEGEVLESITLPGRQLLGEISVGEDTALVGQSGLLRIGQYKFYRSSLLETEAGVLSEGSLLRGSLELYSPDAVAAGPEYTFTNRAQSLNTLVIDNLVGIANPPVELAYRAIPNPAAGFVRIDGESARPPVQTIVVDSQGKVARRFGRTRDVDLTGLPGGMYVLRVFDGKDGGAVLRVVLE